MGDYTGPERQFTIMDPNKMLIAIGTGLALFPPEVNDMINSVLESIPGQRADPWSMLRLQVQPLMRDDEPETVQVVISVQSVASLLGSLQARFDDLRSTLPVGQSDQLEALRSEARTKWMAGLQQLRKEHGGPTGPRG